MVASAGEGEKMTLIGGVPNILLLMLATNELREFFFSLGSSFMCVSSYINRAAPLLNHSFNCSRTVAYSSFVVALSLPYSTCLVAEKEAK